MVFLPDVTEGSMECPHCKKRYKPRFLAEEYICRYCGEPLLEYEM